MQFSGVPDGLRRAGARPARVTGAKPNRIEVRMGNQRTKHPAAGQPAFHQFNATALYCPKCGRAMPVRSRLLLVLPEGDEYTYHCAGCGEVLGKKIDRAPPPSLRLGY